MTDVPTEPVGVLTFKITLWVAPGLRRNVRVKRVNDAIDRFRSLVTHYAATTLPETTSFEIDATWNYLQLERHDSITLSPSTVESPANPY